MAKMGLYFNKMSVIMKKQTSLTNKSLPRVHQAQ